MAIDAAIAPPRPRPPGRLGAWRARHPVRAGDAADRPVPRADGDHGVHERAEVPAEHGERAHAVALHRRPDRPAELEDRLDDTVDQHDGDDHHARDRDPARVLHGVPRGALGAVPAAVARARRRARTGRQDLRLAGDPRPQRDRQLADPGPAEDMVAVQLLRGDRDARGELHHLHDDPDLRGDEGDRRVDVRVGGRPRRGLVGPVQAPADPARGAGDLHRDDPRVHPDAHRLRHGRHRGRNRAAT